MWLSSLQYLNRTPWLNEEGFFQLVMAFVEVCNQLPLE